MTIIDFKKVETKLFGLRFRLRWIYLGWLVSIKCFLIGWIILKYSWYKS